jgi:hypothetical protein
MKHGISKITLFISILIITLSPFSAWAEDEAPTASGDISILSKYVWRGYELSDDSIVIQPSATVGYKGFSFNLWGNLDTDYVATDNSDFNETDLTLAYDTAVGPVGLGFGYIYYGLEGDDTQELYVSAGYDTLLAPSLTVYKDIDQFPGIYVNFGLSHSIELSNGISLDLSGSLGYYDDDTGYSCMHDGLVSAGLTIPIYSYMTLSPSLSYSFSLSDEADGALANNDGDTDFMYGGVTLSIAF